MIIDVVFQNFFGIIGVEAIYTLFGLAIIFILIYCLISDFF